MDEEQRNNDSENDEIHGIRSDRSPSTETVWPVVEALPADVPSVDPNKEYAVSPESPTMVTPGQFGELEFGQYSGSDALEAEEGRGPIVVDEFSALTEAARAGVQTGNDPNGYSDPEVGHVHGESASQQGRLKTFIEAVREYDKLYDCYKSLKSVLEQDILVFEDLKEKVDEAERNDDGEYLKLLVRETKEKFNQVTTYSPIREAFVALHKELTNLKKQIHDVYDHS